MTDQEIPAGNRYEVVIVASGVVTSNEPPTNEGAPE